VFKSAVFSQQAVQFTLSRVTERSVTQVMGKGDALSQVFIEAESSGCRAGDLGDLNGVGEPGSEMVALVVNEYLGLVLKSSESGGMYNSFPVPLKRRPVGMFRLAENPASAAV
jgi:hypothetical protein